MKHTHFWSICVLVCVYPPPPGSATDLENSASETHDFKSEVLSKYDHRFTEKMENKYKVTLESL